MGGGPSRKCGLSRGSVGIAMVAGEGSEFGEEVGVRESCMANSEIGGVYFVMAVGLIG